MDSTLNVTPTHSVVVPAKLPIKRKSRDPIHNLPIPLSISDALLNPDPNSLPQVPTFVKHNSDPASEPPPSKPHRIWSEQDEIRFLQEFLDSGSMNLSSFYTRFSGTMIRHYTKSQISDKLRRLRKKFRVVSARLSEGLDISLLSPHDRALYNISKQLWHPDYAETSQLIGGGYNDKVKGAEFDGVKDSFLAELETDADHNVVENNEFNCENGNNVDDDHKFGLAGLGEISKLSELNVDFDRE